MSVKGLRVLQQNLNILMILITLRHLAFFHSSLCLYFLQPCVEKSIGTNKLHLKALGMPCEKQKDNFLACRKLLFKF